MKAQDMKIGQTFTVKPSTKFHKFVGKEATVVDPTVVPDGQPNQRCVLVEVEGERVYMLPRLLDDGSIRITTNKGATAHAVALPEAERKVVEVNPIIDPMDPRLDDYRPDPSIVKAYVGRKIDGGMKDTDLLLHLWRKRDSHGYSQNTMLVGDTQSGKTMLVQVMACLIAKELGYPKPLPIFTLSGSAGVTDYDMLGQPTAFTDEYGEERLVWLPGLVDLASRIPSILYLDEVNMMPERVTSTLHPICDDRRTFVNRAKAVYRDGQYMAEQVKVNTGTWIVGTYNSGYRGAGALNEAFLNRFRHLPWDYDDNVEKSLIESGGVRLLGKALREARNLRTISTPVGTKALVRLAEDVQDLGIDAAIWIFTGMFPESERAKVRTIIEDRSIAAMLQTEADAREANRIHAENP